MTKWQVAGQRFGDLTAIERIGRSGGRALWLVECSCGKRFRIRSDVLLRGKTSCEHDQLLCSVAACDKRHQARGYCPKHYRKFKKYGNAEYVRETRICSIEDCDKNHFGLGFCSKHYQRLRRHGDPSTVLKPGPSNV